MPSISDIMLSVTTPPLIKDPIIKEGELILNKNKKGEPMLFPGGFSVVFPVTCGADTWAFRCWHTDLGDVGSRLKKVSAYINTIKSSYFCDFYYCDEGIVVDGKIYPTTRMKWVDGLKLNEYIEKNARDKNRMKSLAAKFLEMIDFLHKNHIAHGDLQHGNIMVERDELKLVDYDSMFVPGLEGKSDIIVGKADFQHPKRKDLTITSEKLDYFSELVIYLSIIGISENPQLLQDFSIDDALLFHVDDWNDLENSAIYRALDAIGDSTINLLLQILQDYLKVSDITELRPFVELWAEMEKEPVFHSFTVGEEDGFAYKGLETTIRWNVEHAGKVFLDGEELPRGTCSVSRTFTADKSIKLTVVNGLHRIERIKDVRVVNPPKIKFSSNKYKLKKTATGISSAFLSWKVENAHKVYVKAGSSILSELKSCRKLEVRPSYDTKYEIVVIGLDHKTEFKQSLEIIVREPAQVTFKANRAYTLPGVPVTLSWHARNVKWVRLGNKPVPNGGSTVVKPKENVAFTLSYEDDFCVESQTIEVKMLPLPVVESIMVPVPDLEHTIMLNPKIKSLEVRLKLDNPPMVGLSDSLIKPGYSEIESLFQPLKMDLDSPGWLSRCARKIKRVLKTLTKKHEVESQLEEETTI